MTKKNRSSQAQALLPRRIKVQFVLPEELAHGVRVASALAKQDMSGIVATAIHAHLMELHKKMPQWQLDAIINPDEPDSKPD